MPLTIGSLFAGIGGLELGLERGIGDGCRTVWQVEQDEYCRAVLAKHWPNAKRYEDVRNVGRETLERVDIICGGFPCQDISSAGLKVGIGGKRSGLWSEYARIVRELGPRYIVVENVSALLARGLDEVLGSLAEVGYDAEWDCLSAAQVGAPHIRDRVFILGYPHAHTQPNRAIHEQARRMSAVATDAEYPLRQQRGMLGRAWGFKESPPWNAAGECTDSALAVRVDDGLPNRMDRLRALGNAVVPQVAEVVGRLIAEREKELRRTA